MKHNLFLNIVHSREKWQFYSLLKTLGLTQIIFLDISFKTEGICNLIGGQGFKRLSKKMPGKMESQHANNLIVCILIMHFVDSITVLFHASHIGFSSRIMLLSVCFIWSLSQVHYAVIPSNPRLHFTLSPEFSLLDNRFRLI